MQFYDRICPLQFANRSSSRSELWQAVALYGNRQSYQNEKSSVSMMLNLDSLQLLLDRRRT